MDVRGEGGDHVGGFSGMSEGAKGGCQGEVK